MSSRYSVSLINRRKQACVRYKKDRGSTTLAVRGSGVETKFLRRHQDRGAGSNRKAGNEAAKTPREDRFVVASWIGRNLGQLLGPFWQPYA